jgi:D-glycero-D-manno-heptose 1,7-bisphosphate phosphatase
VERRRFVLLDRDGTVIEDRDYLSDPGDVELIAGAAEALRDLSAAGFGLVIVSNQSGIGRGYFDRATLKLIHAELTRRLEEQGVRLDGIYNCPHRPEDGCRCRKPRPGLVERAAKELGFDPARCWVVGDKASDIRLGWAVAAATVLVRTGRGVETESEGGVAPDHVVDDLRQAARVIVESMGDVSDEEDG